VWPPTIVGSTDARRLSRGHRRLHRSRPIVSLTISLVGIASHNNQPADEIAPARQWLTHLTIFNGDRTTLTRQRRPTELQWTPVWFGVQTGFVWTDGVCFVWVTTSIKIKNSFVTLFFILIFIYLLELLAHSQRPGPSLDLAHHSLND